MCQQETQLGKKRKAKGKFRQDGTSSRYKKTKMRYSTFGWYKGQFQKMNVGVCLYIQYYSEK